MLDIIIPMHNAVEYSRRCIRSIKVTLKDQPYRVHVLDNGSTDETGRWLESVHDAKINVLSVPENMGAPRGKNILLRNISPADYVLFIDNDIEFFDNWLPPFLRVFEDDSKAGVVGIEGYKVKIIQNRREITGVSGDSFQNCDIIRGCFMLTTGELVRKLGGFDPNCGMYWHDDDFCLRAIGEGYRNYWVPTEKIIHHDGKSSDTVPGVRAQKDSVRVQKYLVNKWRRLGIIDPNGRPQAKKGSFESKK